MRGSDCKKFLVRENPKPYKKNLNIVYGLITCKKCSNVWNRDCNGATNIYKIVKGYITGGISSIRNKERPNYLCRSNLSVVLDDTTEPKFT